MDVAATLPAPQGAPGPAAQRIDKTARDFEAMVIAELLKPLFNSVAQPGLAGGGPGEAAFGAMLQEHYAGAITARGGFGVADSVARALMQQQSIQQTDERFAQ